MPVNPYNLDMITKICNHLNTACAIITYRHNFHFEYANDLYYQLFKYKRNDGFNYSLPYSNDYQKDAQSQRLRAHGLRFHDAVF